MTDREHKTSINKIPFVVFPAKAGIQENVMFKTIHQYYVYILASKKNGTLYIGVTNDLPTRVLQHKQKTNEGFTSKYDITLLVYFEHFQYIDHAIKREKQLKKWNRDWKLKLIEEENKEWKDLSEDWYI